MTNTLSIEKYDVPLPNRQDAGKLAFILVNVFTPEECQEWIQMTEERGYSPALINMGTKQTLRPDVRNNARCMIDDVEMAQKLFERIKSYLPNVWNKFQLVGLNERLRFLRYDPGEKFEPHFDGTYCRTDGSFERSFLTIQLYLNEGYKGGETTFINYNTSNKNFPCVPRTGMVLVFEHDILHEGSKLIEGRKYTVRTDVMYRPSLPDSLSKEN